MYLLDVHASQQNFLNQVNRGVVCLRVEVILCPDHRQASSADALQRRTGGNGPHLRSIPHEISCGESTRTLQPINSRCDSILSKCNSRSSSVRVLESVLDESVTRE